MSPHDDVEHRTRHEIDPERVEVHDAAEAVDESGMFRIRMPVTSTGEARDGEAFTRDRLRGFRDQLAAGDIGVFLDHGRNESTGSRYSALGKIGYWANPDIVEREGAVELEADAVIADPMAMDMDVGDVRNHIAWLKTQAETGIPLASSVGWSESTGEREVPGDADLLEISIVGIPSDPRTTTASQETAMARAVATAAEGFDPETFVAAYRDAITAEDVKPATPVHVDGQAEDTQRNSVEVGGEEIDLTPPDAVQNAATVALAKDDELEPDCGTGAGRASARQIAGDDVTADRIDDIAAYLTSHDADVTAEGPPSDWSDEEWRDCGNLQYALWGGTGTGTGLEWAQQKANEVAEASGDERPYPDRDARDRDGPPADTPSKSEQIMTDEDTESADEQSEDTERDEQPDLRETVRDMEAKMEEVREHCEAMREMQEEMYEEMMGDGDENAGDGADEDGDGEGGDGGDGDGDGEEDEEESAADTAESNERTVTVDGEEKSVDEALADLREQADDIDTSDVDPQTTDRATEDSETASDDGGDFWS
jgi:hypothetical protein